jgi:hypothetical protein
LFLQNWLTNIQDVLMNSSVFLQNWLCDKYSGCFHEQFRVPAEMTVWQIFRMVSWKVPRSCRTDWPKIIQDVFMNSSLSLQNWLTNIRDVFMKSSLFLQNWLSDKYSGYFHEKFRVPAELTVWQIFRMFSWTVPCSCRTDWLTQLANCLSERLMFRTKIVQSKGKHGLCTLLYVLGRFYIALKGRNGPYLLYCVAAPNFV